MQQDGPTGAISADSNLFVRAANQRAKQRAEQLRKEQEERARLRDIHMREMEGMIRRRMERAQSKKEMRNHCETLDAICVDTTTKIENETRKSNTLVPTPVVSLETESHIADEFDDSETPKTTSIVSEPHAISEIEINAPPYRQSGPKSKLRNRIVHRIRKLFN